MASRPRRRSSTGMVHGGTTWMRLKCENGHTPLALHAATTSFIGAAASPAALNGTSGSPGLPVPHQLDGPEHAQAAHLADGRVALLQLPQRRADHVGAQRADVLETPSSLKMVIEATAAAQASGWPE